MLVYWAMFGFPAFVALITGKRQGEMSDLNKIALWLTLVAFVILIGLRYDVGADWLTYETIVNNIRLENFWAAVFEFGDPGFNLVAWFSTRINADTWGPNFVCAIILAVGLVKFCRQQDDVWLALCASVPYLVIVVGMGYVRQAAAIGFLLIALIRFERGQFARSVFWIAMAALFHASVVIVAPLFALAIARKRISLMIPIGIAGLVLFFVLLQERVQTFYELYVENEFDSSGAMVRLLMNAVPAIILIIFRKRIPGSPWGRAMWLWFAFMSLVLVFAVSISASTTILDRIGLYFIPLQIYVFGNLSLAMGVPWRGRLWISMLVVAYYAAILFVWLNFATHSDKWVPYRFTPTEGWPEPFSSRRREYNE